MPCTAETAEMVEDTNGNFRSLNNLVMKGDDVFNFVQREVPPMIEHLIEKANVHLEDIDCFMFHQPNKFMLHKLADKIGVPREKMPANIVENFGNASGVTVTTNISYNLGDEVEVLVEKVSIEESKITFSLLNNKKTNKIVVHKKSKSKKGGKKNGRRN